MSKPYDCGHPDDSEDHDEYCGVGACYVCEMRGGRDGFPPHGVVMCAERTLEVTIVGHPEVGPLLRVQVCGDCGVREAMPEYDPLYLVETFS